MAGFFLCLDFTHRTTGIYSKSSPKQRTNRERKILSKSVCNASPEEMVHLIRSVVAAFAGSEPQNDDITLLVMGYR